MTMTISMPMPTSMIKRLGYLLLCLASGVSWAADPDILISDQMRRASVEPQCRELVVQSSEGTPEHTYNKALCLLYGLQTAPQTTLALALLRQAAQQGWLEAHLALGDTLQQGSTDDQAEALRWYASAIAAGDVRATGRHARLSARILQRQAAEKAAGQGAQSPATSDPGTPPGFGDGMPVNPSSYHCHMTGFGKRFCHSAGD